MQQAEPALGYRPPVRELQFLRIIQRAANHSPLPATSRQPIGIVNLRMNGVAYPAFIIPTAKHTHGHRRNAKLLNIFTGVEMVSTSMICDFHQWITNLYAPTLALSSQSVNGKRSIARLRGEKPECGEVRELFLTVGIGIISPGPRADEPY